MAKKCVAIDEALVVSRRALLKRGYVTAEHAKVRPEDSVWSWAIANALKANFMVIPDELLGAIQLLGITFYNVNPTGSRLDYDDSGPEVA